MAPDRDFPLAHLGIVDADLVIGDQLLVFVDQPLYELAKAKGAADDPQVHAAIIDLHDCRCL
jgi:hypothetical protein